MQNAPILQQISSKLVRPAFISFFAVLVLTSTVVQADSHATESADNAILQTVEDNLAKRLPGMPVTSVSTSAIDGLYEIVTEGLIYYVDITAQFLIDGSMIDLDTRENLTDARLGGLHMAMIEQLGDDKMLVYTPEKPINRSITVFTDISCGYCRRLHSELDTLLEAGISVRYLMFPRAGLETQSHQDLESVWCASNPQDAMTIAKAGGEIIEENCENPIEEHVAMAEQIGLRGTPLIYLDTGVKIPGYREANVLVEMIKSAEPMAQ